MKRKLNKTERELTIKGRNRREKEIKEKTESLEINNVASKHIKESREYEDKLRPYNRKIEDKNMKLKIELLESDLKIANTDLENLKDQLANGIEIKKPRPMTGVN